MYRWYYSGPGVVMVVVVNENRGEDILWLIWNMFLPCRLCLSCCVLYLLYVAWYMSCRFDEVTIYPVGCMTCTMSCTVICMMCPVSPVIYLRRTVLPRRLSEMYVLICIPPVGFMMCTVFPLVAGGGWHIT
jgi:hypothetical protein